MKKYTITEFRKDYPNDDACLDKLYKLRFAGLTCPKCYSDNPFIRVKGRRSYQCSCCAFQLYPTQGTVFEKTTTPLTYWFYANFLQTTTRNGVAAKELERQLNVCYKTALRMAHQIKKLMADNNEIKMTGIVEIDETFIGGKAANKHNEIRKAQLKEGTGYKHKMPVFGMLERNGRIFLRAIPFGSVNGKSLKPMIRKNANKNSTLITDGFGAYKDLNLEFKAHEVVNHNENEYVRGNFHTNSIEGFWAQLKRTIGGTHISVSRQHLQKYVDEVAFRYMHRDNQDIMFDTILKRVAS
jgi:transposase-like protein